VDGLQATLTALRAARRLEETDEALVALAEGLAAAVDADPSNAALWREYRAAVTALSQCGQGVADDDTTSFLVSIRTPRVPAALGDGSDT
jgi:hypothetical protein